MYSMHGHTTAKDILHSFNNLSIWDIEAASELFLTLCSATTDACPSMIGCNNGFVTLLRKQIEPLLPHRFLSFPCTIHQEALATKFSKSSTEYEIVMSVSKMVNTIEAKSELSRREFRSFVEQIQSELVSVRELVKYCNSRWLSSGNLLNRFCDLLPSVVEFMKSKDKLDKYPELINEEWRLHLFFLADILGILNKLNVQMQGPNKSLLNMERAMTSYAARFQFYAEKLAKEDYSSFPRLYAAVQNGAKVPIEKNGEFIELADSIKTNLITRTQHITPIKPILTFFEYPFIPITDIQTMAKVNFKPQNFKIIHI